MKLVVVGGESRKVGKTSVIAGLISELKTLAWTAVKISHHSGDMDSRANPSADELPPHVSFSLSEEADPEGAGDTSRYLAAGARRALWLRAREEGLAKGLSELFRALEGERYVVIESNSVLAFVKPDLFLLVTAEPGREVKTSAQQFIGRADALVTVELETSASGWPGSFLSMPSEKPVFAVTVGTWSNPALCRFVCERLESASR